MFFEQRKFFLRTFPNPQILFEQRLAPKNAFTVYDFPEADKEIVTAHFSILKNCFSAGLLRNLAGKTYSMPLLR